MWQFKGCQLCDYMTVENHRWIFNSKFCLGNDTTLCRCVIGGVVNGGNGLKVVGSEFGKYFTCHFFDSLSFCLGPDDVFISVVISEFVLPLCLNSATSIIKSYFLTTYFVLGVMGLLDLIPAVIGWRWSYWTSEWSSRSVYLISLKGISFHSAQGLWCEVVHCAFYRKTLCHKMILKVRFFLLLFSVNLMGSKVFVLQKPRGGVLLASFLFMINRSNKDSLYSAPTLINCPYSWKMASFTRTDCWEKVMSVMLWLCFWHFFLDELG